MNIRGRLISYFMISIVFPIVIYLASMYKLDKSLAEVYLKKLKDDDKISEKMFEMIKGGK